MLSIISAIIGGLIIGALARFVMPGKQNIGVIMTIVLGMVGAFLGSWVVTRLFAYDNGNGGFAIIPFLVGIVFAVILIAAYLGITGRRGAKTR